ncbi:MAG: substrate-binding domain-containing protein [Bryobacterales bacterium]
MTRRDWLSLAALAGAGCHKEGGTVIGVAPKGTSSIFWQSVQAGSLAAAKKYNVEILWNGPPQETEYARQIQIVDSMINRQVAGIVLSPTDGAALVAPVERAMAQGFPSRSSTPGSTRRTTSRSSRRTTAPPAAWRRRR